MILACDVGGTKTNVALLEQDGVRLTVVRQVSFPSREHASLRGIIIAFFGGARPKLRATNFVCGAHPRRCAAPASRGRRVLPGRERHRCLVRHDVASLLRHDGDAL